MPKTLLKLILIGFVLCSLSLLILHKSDKDRVYPIFDVNIDTFFGNQVGLKLYPDKTFIFSTVATQTKGKFYTENGKIILSEEDNLKIPKIIIECSLLEKQFTCISKDHSIYEKFLLSEKQYLDIIKTGILDQDLTQENLNNQIIGYWESLEGGIDQVIYFGTETSNAKVVIIYNTDESGTTRMQDKCLWGYDSGILTIQNCNSALDYKFDDVKIVDNKLYLKNSLNLNGSEGVYIKNN